MTRSSLSLEASYRACESIASGSNFHAAFRLLPAKKHRALSAVYAFLRKCDDISDEPGDIAEKRKAFAKWRAAFDRSLNNQGDEHPILPALRDTVSAFQIPRDYFYRLIEGTEMDLATTRYNTFEDLRKYCYLVASIVGLICIRIFGFRDERAMELAESCGIAFQITNILRDLKEDLARDRVYLPQEDLRNFQLTEEDLRNEVTDNRFVSMMRFETDRAKTFYEKASPLTSCIEPDSRAAFRAMYETYRALLTRIENAGFQVFGPRIRLKTSEKLRILFKALLYRQ